MPLIFTRQAVRKIDELAVSRYGIPSIVLMENAARHVADYACAMIGPVRSECRVGILCGGGNNGGDGLAAARHLHNRGVAVEIVLLKPRDDYQGDARTNLDISTAMRLPIHNPMDGAIDLLESLGTFDLLIDGLLGTGLVQDVRQPMDDLITWINQQSTPVLAIDIPSGLDCDSGLPRGNAVKAQLTVTLVGLKKGFSSEGAESYTGRVVVADIGAPRALIEELGVEL